MGVKGRPWRFVPVRFICPGWTGSVGNTACSCAARTGAGAPGFTMRGSGAGNRCLVSVTTTAGMCCSRGMPGVGAGSPSRSLSSYRRSCADERACQGWRSHHVVTPKAPFTRPIGKSDNCADEEWGRCPPAAGRDSLTRRRLGRGRSVPRAWPTRATCTPTHPG